MIKNLRWLILPLLILSFRGDKIESDFPRGWYVLRDGTPKQIETYLALNHYQDIDLCKYFPEKENLVDWYKNYVSEDFYKKRNKRLLPGDLGENSVGGLGTTAFLEMLKAKKRFEETRNLEELKIGIAYGVQALELAPNSYGRSAPSYIEEMCNQIDSINKK